MRVAVGSDDLYDVARFIVEEFERKGFKVVKVGALKTGSLYPWPSVGFEVGKLVANGEVDFGVVVCYTGTGVAIAANKVKGVRAALCVDAETAKGARKWNDANVLAISARLVTTILAREIIEAWLETREIDSGEVDNIKMVKRYEAGKLDF
ncbi:MAG: RpiB/LacA/LacB family sugar-phosphate isomerase [Candidatus Bathyarchaeota archaeon]